MESALKEYEARQEEIRKEQELEKQERKAYCQKMKQDLQNQTEYRKQLIQDHLTRYARTVFDHLVDQVNNNPDVCQSLIEGARNGYTNHYLLYRWRVCDSDIPVPVRVFYSKISIVGESILKSLDNALDDDLKKTPYLNYIFHTAEGEIVRVRPIDIIYHWCHAEPTTHVLSNTSPFPGWTIQVIITDMKRLRLRINEAEPEIQIILSRPKSTIIRKVKLRLTRRPITYA